MVHLSRTFRLFGHLCSTAGKQPQSVTGKHPFCHSESFALLKDKLREESLISSSQTLRFAQGLSRACRGSDSFEIVSKLTIPLLVLLAICFFALPAQAEYGGGTGEPNDPYLINTAEQMNAIGAEPNDWDKDFKLMADIDLSSFTGTAFNIIGYYISYDDKKPFTGVFDGSGHTISNFSYTSTDRDYIGLFGFVDGAEIKDLGLINPNIEAGEGWAVSSLVGSLDEGTITGCYAEGGSVSGNWQVGGLVGINGGTITNCYATGSVTGTGTEWWYGGVGGLVGSNEAGTVSASLWDTNASGQSTSAGGTGKTTAEMQTESTFTDIGWDFVAESINGTEDIWSICEGTNYPRLLWQIPAGDFVCPDGITEADFSFFLAHWLDSNCDLANDYCEGTDLNKSGAVDNDDLEIFLENWQAGGDN